MHSTMASPFFGDNCFAPIWLSERVCWCTSDGVLDTRTINEKILNATSQLFTTMKHLCTPDALRWGRVIEYELLFIRGSANDTTSPRLFLILVYRLNIQSAPTVLWCCVACCMLFMSVVSLLLLRDDATMGLRMFRGDYLRAPSLPEYTSGN